MRLLRRRDTLRLFLLLLLPWLCAACARVTALEGPPKALAQLAEAGPPALEAATPEPAPRLKEVLPPDVSEEVSSAPETSDAAAIPPPPPALLPAEVFAVWVPDHLTDDATYVTGHWVYVLHEPSRWPLPRIPGPATLKVPRPPVGRAAEDARRPGLPTAAGGLAVTPSPAATVPATGPVAPLALRRMSPLPGQPPVVPFGHTPTGLTVPGTIPGTFPPGGSPP